MHVVAGRAPIVSTGVPREPATVTGPSQLSSSTILLCVAATTSLPRMHVPSHTLTVNDCQFFYVDHRNATICPACNMLPHPGQHLQPRTKIDRTHGTQDARAAPGTLCSSPASSYAHMHTQPDALHTQRSITCLHASRRASHRASNRHGAQHAMATHRAFSSAQDRFCRAMPAFDWQNPETNR